MSFKDRIKLDFEPEPLQEDSSEYKAAIQKAIDLGFLPNQAITGPQDVNQGGNMKAQEPG